jgi:hypothetical protein
MMQVRVTLSRQTCQATRQYRHSHILITSRSVTENLALPAQSHRMERPSDKLPTTRRTCSTDALVP